ncbi:MAG: hypothetical protein GY934_15810, partial [Gammaproteobacteria bacterium]|nr:hypothetical protein [Gammaproteobacteria bacterium]
MRYPRAWVDDLRRRLGMFRWLSFLQQGSMQLVGETAVTMLTEAFAQVYGDTGQAERYNSIIQRVYALADQYMSDTHLREMGAQIDQPGPSSNSSGSPIVIGDTTPIVGSSGVTGREQEQEREPPLAATQIAAAQPSIPTTTEPISLYVYQEPPMSQSNTPIGGGTTVTSGTPGGVAMTMSSPPLLAPAVVSAPSVQGSTVARP